VNRPQTKEGQLNRPYGPLFKNCQQKLRVTGKWEDFIELVKIYY
jgi:hypothetical protein